MRMTGNSVSLLTALASLSSLGFSGPLHSGPLLHLFKCTYAEHKPNSVLEIPPDRINVCDVSAIKGLAHDTHVDLNVVLRTCGTPYPCSDHLCIVPDGFWVCLTSAMAHNQTYFCPGNCSKNYGILISTLFFPMMENIMPFPSNPPLPEEVCFLSEEQETALCACAHLCLSLIVPSQLIEVLLPCLCSPTQCKNPSSLRSASSVIEMVWNPLV